ncbi:MAG TPA: GNAT family N-acetyltransferase [Amycolatopsis sp.]|nr:GNAT family N-acetyltransferase [Amycolatopsis sp.]
MVRLRPARPDEGEALSALARSAYARYTERIGREPAPLREDYRTLAASGQVWVAEQDGALVGLLVLKIESDHVLLDNVAVAPRAQNAGIGRRLLDFTDLQARHHGLGEVRLYTNEAMTENIDYYRRRGFVETHRTVDDGYRRVFFTKSV